MPPTRLDPPTHKHKHKQGAFLVPADYGTGASGMVESPHANIFMSMFYIVSDTTTSESEPVCGRRGWCTIDQIII